MADTQMREREQARVEPVRDSNVLSLVILSVVMILMVAVVMWATTNPNLQTNRWMPDSTVITPTPATPQTTITPAAPSTTVEGQIPAAGSQFVPGSSQGGAGIGANTTPAEPETPLITPQSRPSQPAPIGSVPRSDSSVPSPVGDESAPGLDGVEQR
jgi:hypothetical protein